MITGFRPEVIIVDDVTPIETSKENSKKGKGRKLNKRNRKNDRHHKRFFYGGLEGY